MHRAVGGPLGDKDGKGLDLGVLTASWDQYRSGSQGQVLAHAEFGLQHLDLGGHIQAMAPLMLMHGIPATACLSTDTPTPVVTLSLSPPFPSTSVFSPSHS